MLKSAKMILGVPVLALAVLAVPSWAQEDPGTESEIETLRKDIQQLRAGQAAIRRQLTEIKSLVQKGGGGQQQQQRQAQQLPDVTIDLKGQAYRGKADAPITVVEFSDFQ